jgi:hypothetical protein
MSLKADRGNTTVVINPDDPDELILSMVLRPSLTTWAELITTPSKKRQRLTPA